MFDSTYLTLLIGPAALPVPAPLPVMEALQSVEIDQSPDRSGFQLTFSMAKTSLLQTALIPAGFFDPVATRVVVVVTVRGLPQVLVDGIVTRQDMSASSTPGAATLTLTGEDLSVLMDLVEMRLPFPAMPDAARVALILGKYAAFGVVPLIIPPPVVAVDSPTSRFDTQTGTDRAYLKQLAEDSGYVFFVEPGPLPLQSVAYFGPPVALPVPQRALKINMDSETNVEALRFGLDGLAKRTTITTILDPVTHKIPIPVPVPDIDPIKPPLGLRPTPPGRIVRGPDSSSLTAPEAAKRAIGRALRSASAITASGSLNVASYGGVLRARMQVGVTGAGLAYDGLYNVDGVTHSLKPGEYKQSFQLSRDGLISMTPVVVP